MVLDRAHLDRRGFLTLGAAGALAACSTQAPQSIVTSHPTTTSPTTTETLPSVVRWAPHAGEETVAAKTSAVRRIEALGNDTSHRLQVIDAQYGGLLADSASVLVVCRTWTRTDARVVEGGTTYDVHLRLAGGQWQVTSVNPSDPGPAAAGLSTAARHVLQSSRIDLPPAARADIASGAVHDTALEAMLTVAIRWRIGISVIRSGHPLYVFGTTRLSDHPRGRAFDTWAVDGEPVVSAGAPPAVVPAYMEALASAGSYNVGGPVLLGSAPQYFSDVTHHDHVHAGFAG